jgi:acetylornithine deacetylase/succinyl-diaminopimelate desuccinylase-like protein
MKTIGALLALAGGASLTAGLAGQQQSPALDTELAVVRRTIASAPVQAAFTYLRGAGDETVQEWMSLCNASGPSGFEARRSRLIYKLFRIYGLENVHIDDALNVIGVRPGVGEGPTVVLNAHHDNVALSPTDQPVEAFVADGRVWCPAAFDDLLGVTQLLTVLRALNAGNIVTRGDIWFVAVTGEEAPNGPEHPDASPGTEQFVRANYPHNIDWRKGDALLQFHGRGGEGVTTGSTPVRHRTQLRVFAPFEQDRWGPNAVDALAAMIVRIGEEVRDSRATRMSFQSTGAAPTGDVLFMNMAMIEASEIISRPASEAWVRFDMRADHEARLVEAHQAIRGIAGDVVSSMGNGLSFVYEINSVNGLEGGIAGWDAADNPPARMAAAAAQALYGVAPVIDPSTGCGDCVRAYRSGMPAMSLAGNVVDRGDGQPIVGASQALVSPTRRRTASHDVTESAEIARIWSGVKQGLIFAVSYAGMAN